MSADSKNPSQFFTAAEFGAEGPKAPPRDPAGMPKGDGLVPVAHPSMFAGLFSGSNRTYYQWFDNALKNGRVNSERMLNDPVIVSSLRLRTTPTALLTHHCEPEDNSDEAQVEAAKQFDRMIKKLKGLQHLKRWLLYNGVWKGRSAGFLRFARVWDAKTGRMFENPVEFETPIDGDKLCFRYDRSLGVTVGAGFFGPTEYVAGFGRAYFYTPEEREQTVLFRFEPEDSDFFNPQQAGLVNGKGLRHNLYYLWALKSQLWSASIDFLEFWARGILIFYFEHGNAAHLDSVSQWVEQFDGQWQRLFPRMKDGGPGYKPVERIEANPGTNSFLQDLITNYLDDLIRQIIIGQTLTTKADATGLGSGVADAHVGTFEQVIKYDANLLDECFTYEIVEPWYRANYPGMPHGYWKSEVDSPNVEQLMDSAETLYNLGGNIPEQSILEAMGLPETKEGDTILTQVQPMQPAAVQGMPEGVPQVDGQPPGQQPVRMSASNWNKIVRAARTNTRAARLARKLQSRIVLY